VIHRSSHHPDWMNHIEWRDVCRLAQQELKRLVDTGDPAVGEKIFCVVRQISSVLRTKLAVESPADST
jgi:hypothetical protein